MPSDTHEKKYLDIRYAPQRLRKLAEERERMWSSEADYRALQENGRIKDVIDREVKRMQEILLKLVQELQAKGYGDEEAHERAWQSLLRNWPFMLDDGEPEKEPPAKEKPPSGPAKVHVTGRSGIHYVLSCPDPITEDFKRLARALQGDRSR